MPPLRHHRNGVLRRPRPIHVFDAVLKRYVVGMFYSVIWKSCKQLHMCGLQNDDLLSSVSTLSELITESNNTDYLLNEKFQTIIRVNSSGYNN